MALLICDKYNLYKEECNKRFEKLRENEEQLNRLFANTYGLSNSVPTDVSNRDVTVHKIFDSRDDVPENMKNSNYVRTKADEIKSLISYSVGCFFGRYSIDKEGICFAGGKWHSEYYSTIIPTETGIIPIYEMENSNDIVDDFINFVKTVYGDETINENLEFISTALYKKGSPRENIRHYFLNEFYSDHIKTYSGRPIYWLFESGKKKAFNALVYMHSLNKTTISNILNLYLVPYINSLENKKEEVISKLNENCDIKGKEKAELKRKLEKLEIDIEECKNYREKLEKLSEKDIEIHKDLGVNYNYKKFEDVLAKLC